MRALLERPLDPSVGRAAVVFAAAIFIALAGLVLLSETDPEGHPGASPIPATPPSLQAETQAPEPPPTHSQRGPLPTQDPQDESGSAAAARAQRETSTHRALQHIPYRAGGVRIALVGAKGGRAILRVTARNLAVARRSWRAFLRRYHDTGSSYSPRFVGGLRR